jgi:type I restriction enzyme R subunit
VDYAGVARHLREALAVFDDKDVDEMLKVVKSDAAEIDELKYNYGRLKDFFRNYDIEDLRDVDACVDLLADEEARNDFLVLFKAFSKSMDATLPRKEALAYAQTLKTVSFISQTARNRYRDEKLSVRDASQKIRAIVEEFLITHGVDPKIPPIPIFSDKFKSKLREEKTDRAKAEELKHAIQEHIRLHQEEDPELYERFGEKLEQMLKAYKDNWESLATELEGLLEEIEKGRMAENTFGLDPKAEMPFLGLLKKEVFGVRNVADLNQEQLGLLLTQRRMFLRLLGARLSLSISGETIAHKSA